MDGGGGGFTEMIEQARRRCDPKGTNRTKEDWDSVIGVQRERLKLAEMILVKSAVDDEGDVRIEGERELAEEIPVVPLVESVSDTSGLLWTGMEELLNFESLDALGSVSFEEESVKGMGDNWSVMEIDRELEMEMEMEMQMQMQMVMDLDQWLPTCQVTVV